MQTKGNAMSRDDEELHDTLIAISVLAKRMAKRISEGYDGEEVRSKDGKDERTQRNPRRAG